MLLRQLSRAFLVVFAPAILGGCLSQDYDPKLLQVQDFTSDDAAAYAPFKNAIWLSPDTAVEGAPLPAGAAEAIQPYFGKAVSLSLANNGLYAAEEGKARYRLSAVLMALDMDAKGFLVVDYNHSATVRYRLLDLTTGEQADAEIKTDCKMTGWGTSGSTQAYIGSSRCALTTNIATYLDSLPVQIFRQAADDTPE